MSYWKFVLAAIVGFILIIVVYKRWRTCKEHELELFEVMSADCVAMTVSTTASIITHNVISMVKGETYTISGSFTKTTLHIIPRTEKAKADVAQINSIKFGCWQSICEINKVEIHVKDTKQITITAYNKSTSNTLDLHLQSADLCLYHYIPSTASETDDALKIVKA